jgi:murein DD-endopeptidase MepM/ murein hydrolase activator NlpD
MRTLALLLTILSLPAQAANLCGNMVMPAGALGSISRGFTSYHSGIDLAAPLGSTIRSAAAGTVVWAGWYAGYGNMVDIQHADGVLTRYAHMSAYVPELGYGTPVKAGQVIGLVGQTGHATGNHIHFEVRLGGYAVDPAPFIGLGRCIVQPPRTPVEEAFAPTSPTARH